MYNNTSNVIGSFFISYFSSSYVYICIYICLQKATRESDIERDTKTSIIIYDGVQKKEDDVYFQWYFPLIKYFFWVQKI